MGLRLTDSCDTKSYARKLRGRPITPKTDIHKPVTGTNNIKKCNQRLSSPTG